jgi:hypothetical protein
MKPPERIHEQDEPPPIGGNWNRIYGAIVIYTLVLIFALYWMTAALNH